MHEGQRDRGSYADNRTDRQARQHTSKARGKKAETAANHGIEDNCNRVQTLNSLFETEPSAASLAPEAFFR